jgi:hypothetical protein
LLLIETFGSNLLKNTYQIRITKIMARHLRIFLCLIISNDAARVEKLFELKLRAGATKINKSSQYLKNFI